MVEVDDAVDVPDGGRWPDNRPNGRVDTGRHADPAAQSQNGEQAEQGRAAEPPQSKAPVGHHAEPPGELLIEVAGDGIRVVGRETVTQDPPGEAGRPHDRFFSPFRDRPAHILACISRAVSRAVTPDGVSVKNHRAAGSRAADHNRGIRQCIGKTR